MQKTHQPAERSHCHLSNKTRAEWWQLSLARHKQRANRPKFKNLDWHGACGIEGLWPGHSPTIN